MLQLQNAEQTWTNCLSIIRDQIPESTFGTWFESTRGKALDDKNLVVEIPNDFVYQWLEGHYRELVHKAAFQVLGDEYLVTYVLAEARPLESESKPAEKISAPSARLTHDPASQISPHYKFQNFVEGSSNQFAKAAAVAVAEAPGKTSFNPLVVYGGVGLGKTHLIQAIGNLSLDNAMVTRALYVSSERFTNEFINSIQNNKTTEFSSNYRNVDLLIVDDIQFFMNKERTQEEFFHTFNALYQKGKQIVLSSDRPPKEIVGIEDRLLSRCQWGLVVDIQPPDLETRIAILQRKAEENGIDLPSDVIQLIAHNITSNIRELEGSLIRLLAFASVNKHDITLNLARHVLKDLFIQKLRNLTVEDIQKEVCDYYKMPDDMMRAKTRKKEVALARQIAMYLAKKLTKHSLKTIGLHFGGRDHTTVIHAIDAIEKLMETDIQIKSEVDVLKQRLSVA
ncbi:chromosomal replication initiator protein DnaA [bacterium]|nr:MAG: chromosomal replication initiator protein DnaA [candidate division KSB1 bacterium]MCE7941277.1 chromosomal replication initiator protein DnaA [Chlorobi bacterium CHB1]MCL4709420.1 chromosomal replication initiator protein DnaA [bacterium]MDL1875096.1 chromosomal replication initiator protein DnaA [Cytophagia bacterium CHB2]MBC6949248.1 chromosomal replication initiator protein DnaA [candidate division KSB1 bacterium]